MSRETKSMMLWATVLVVLTTAVVVFFFQVDSIRSNTELLVLDAQVRNDRPKRTVDSGARRMRSMQSAERLRRRLEESSELYRSQLDQLAKKEKEHHQLSSDYEELAKKYQSLQREYNELWQDADTSLDSMIDMLQYEADGGESPAPGESAEDETIANELSPSEEENLSLDLAQWELDQAQRQISELEAAAERASQVSMAFSSVLIEVGAAATPELLPMLRDERPEIRSWAAWVLGHIRPVDAETQPALEQLLFDDNTDVAAAARSALQDIKQTR